jgi:hypothetical protein
MVKGSSMELKPRCLSKRGEGSYGSLRAEMRVWGRSFKSVEVEALQRRLGDLQCPNRLLVLRRIASSSKCTLRDLYSDSQTGSSRKHSAQCTIHEAVGKADTTTLSW